MSSTKASCVIVTFIAAGHTTGWLSKLTSHVCSLLPCQEAQGEASRKRKAEREQSFVPPPEGVQGKGKKKAAAQGVHLLTASHSM